MRPTRPARAAASAAYRSGCPAARPANAVAVIRAVVDSGPTDSWGEDPRTAYTTSDATAAHNPTTAGRPATSAYAIT